YPRLPRPPARRHGLELADGGLEPHPADPPGRRWAVVSPLAGAPGGEHALDHLLAWPAARPRLLAAPPHPLRAHRRADVRYLRLARRLHRADIYGLRG